MEEREATLEDSSKGGLTGGDKLVQSKDGGNEDRKSPLPIYERAEQADGDLRKALTLSLEDEVYRLQEEVTQLKDQLNIYKYIKEASQENLSEDLKKDLREILRLLKDKEFDLVKKHLPRINDKTLKGISGEKDLKKISENQIKAIEEALNHKLAGLKELTIIQARLEIERDDKIHPLLWAQKYMIPTAKNKKALDRIMETLGMKGVIGEINSKIQEKIIGVQGQIDQTIEKGYVPEVVLIFGKDNKKGISTVLSSQDKYYEDNGLSKRQIIINLDDISVEKLIEAFGSFYNTESFLGTIKTYYPAEFIMGYLINPLQEEIFKDKDIKGTILCIAKIPLSARGSGIRLNMLGQGLYHKGALVSTYPYTTGKMGWLTKYAGSLPIAGKLTGLAFKTSLQKVINHELGHVYGLGHDEREEKTVMSSSKQEKKAEKFSFLIPSWLLHFWRVDSTYRKEHLDKIKEDISGLLSSSSVDNQENPEDIIAKDNDGGVGKDINLC